MRNRGATALPIPDKDAKLRPADFSAVLSLVPRDCVLIGGQAVAWWADRFEIKPVVKGRQQPVTSRDIDFWGSRDDLLQMAAKLGRRAALPGPYDMTLLVGALELMIGGKKTSMEVLHSVPGLDTSNPETAAVADEFNWDSRKYKLLILSPVSLVLAKLHALRHYPQDERQDLSHLKVCLAASKAFIAEILERNTRLVLWNCNRLIDAHQQKPNQKLEAAHDFQILSAVPIDAIQAYVAGAPAPDRKKLQRFLTIQWPAVGGG